MDTLAPSFLLKMERAEKHLLDLRDEISKFCETHPYKVIESIEGSKRAHRLKITSSPPLAIGLIAGDFIHNVRSGLDHLACALVPPGHQSRVSFPIMWQGIWNDPVAGEEPFRAEARERWERLTKHMKPEAVAIIKALQPPDDQGRDPNWSHNLRLLHGLWNRDKHRQLVAVSTGVRESIGTWSTPDGTIRTSPDKSGAPAWEYLFDGAELGFPEDAVNATLTGVPIVVLEVGSGGQVQIPASFEGILRFVREGVIDRLIPFLWVTPGGLK